MNHIQTYCLTNIKVLPKLMVASRQKYNCEQYLFCLVPQIQHQTGFQVMKCHKSIRKACLTFATTPKIILPESNVPTQWKIQPNGLYRITGNHRISFLKVRLQYTLFIKSNTQELQCRLFLYIGKVTARSNIQKYCSSYCLLCQAN